MHRNCRIVTRPNALKVWAGLHEARAREVDKLHDLIGCMASGSMSRNNRRLLAFRALQSPREGHAIGPLRCQGKRSGLSEYLLVKVVRAAHLSQLSADEGSALRGSNRGNGSFGGRDRQQRNEARRRVNQHNADEDDAVQNDQNQKPSLQLFLRMP